MHIFLHCFLICKLSVKHFGCPFAQNNLQEFCPIPLERTGVCYFAILIVLALVTMFVLFNE